jgi:O-antigen/teichoic acid export membrane protein
VATGVAAGVARSKFGSAPGGELLLHPVLLGVCVTLVGVYQAGGAWLLRRGGYRAFAWMRLSQGGGFSTLALLPGLGLLWAHVVSFGGGVVVAVRALRRRAGRDAPWTDVGRRHGKFPLLNLPGAVLDVVGYSMCVWVVASFYGRGSAGEYSQVQRLIGAPLMLISISLGQILLKHTAELMDDPTKLRLLLGRLLRVMAALATTALLALWGFGQPLLAWILGPKWHVTREMVVFLGVAVFVRACVSPLSTALLTLRRFGLILGWQSAYFCSAALLMPFVAARVPFNEYVRFYALHECAFYGAYLYLIFLAVRTEKCAEYSAS